MRVVAGVAALVVLVLVGLRNVGVTTDIAELDRWVGIFVDAIYLPFTSS